MLDNSKHEQLVLKVINVLKTQEENTDHEILTAVQTDRDSLDEQKVRQGFTKMSKTKRQDTTKKVITLLLQEEGFPTTSWWVQSVFQQEEVAKLICNKQVLKKVLQQVTQLQVTWCKGELQSVLKALGDSQEANEVLEKALSKQFSNSNIPANQPELHRRFKKLPKQTLIASAEDQQEMGKWWQFCHIKTVEEWPHLTTEQQLTEKEKFALFKLEQDLAEMVSAKLKSLSIPYTKRTSNGNFSAVRWRNSQLRNCSTCSLEMAGAGITLTSLRYWLNTQSVRGKYNQLCTNGCDPMESSNGEWR